MKKINFIFSLLLIILSLQFICAIPSSPHAFHGVINTNDYSNPNRLTLIGKINDVATGSCIISNNQYDLVVVDYSGTGGNIEFYIGDEKADESVGFITFEVTELDLNFDTAPEEIGFCGNSICETDECYSCPIDCGISECLGNGVCDDNMGEDCATAPIDCGSCSIDDDDDSDNDDSSSNDDNNGGGGGGSGDIPSNQITQTTNSDGTVNLNLETSEEGNETIDVNENQESTGSGITGAVIGFVKSRTGIGFIVAGLIFIIGMGIMNLKKKKTPKQEEGSEDSK